jgi:hypothetical protein
MVSRFPPTCAKGECPRPLTLHSAGPGCRVAALAPGGSALAAPQSLGCLLRPVGTATISLLLRAISLVRPMSITTVSDGRPRTPYRFAGEDRRPRLAGQPPCRRTLISPANQSDASVLDGEAITDAEFGGAERATARKREHRGQRTPRRSSPADATAAVRRGETSAPDQERRSGKPSVRAPACCSQKTCLAAAKPRSAVAGRRIGPQKSARLSDKDAASALFGKVRYLEERSVCRDMPSSRRTRYRP